MDLTPEQSAYFKKLADPRFDGEPDENGVDVSLIRENLARTPSERLRRGNRFSKLLFELVPDLTRIDGICLNRRWIWVLEDLTSAQEAGDRAQIKMLQTVADRLLSRTHMPN